MTFIEQWLHIDPDGGSGTLEALIVAGLALLIGARGWRRRRAVAQRSVRR
jgi:hypothetical protein